jgi:hypothetical protein
MRRALLLSRPPVRGFAVSARGYDPTLSLFLPPSSLFRSGKLREYEPGFPLASPRAGPGGPAQTSRAAARHALKMRPIMGPESRPWASSRSMLATDEMRRLARRGHARLAEHLAAKEMDKDVTIATGALTPSARVIIANSPKPGQVVDGRVTPQRKQELVGDEARDRVVRAFGAYSPLVRAGVETALNTRLLVDERAQERVYEQEFFEKAPEGPAVARAVERAFSVAGEVAALALRAEALGYAVTERRRGGGGAAGAPNGAPLRHFKLRPSSAGMAAAALEEGELPLARPGSYGLPSRQKAGGDKGPPLAAGGAALAANLATGRRLLLRSARDAFMDNGVEVSPFSAAPHSKALSRVVRTLQREQGPRGGARPAQGGAGDGKGKRRS